MAHEAERIAGRFHPTIYEIIGDLAAPFVISAWIIAGNEETDFLLVVVSGLVMGVTRIPSLLAFARCAHRRHLRAATRDDE